MSPDRRADDGRDRGGRGDPGDVAGRRRGDRARAADGSLIGLLVPGPDPLPTGYIDPDLTEEEIQKRLAPDAKTYTTAEVLAYLRSLT